MLKRVSRIKIPSDSVETNVSYQRGECDVYMWTPEIVRLQVRELKLRELFAELHCGLHKTLICIHYFLGQILHSYVEKFKS